MQSTDHQVRHKLMQLAEGKFNTRQCMSLPKHWTIFKNSSWHRGKNPLVWQKQVIPFHPCAFHALPPPMAEHKHYQTYCYPLLQQWKHTTHLWVWQPQASTENMQEMKELISWGFGGFSLGSFLGLFWAVFLWWFVGCSLIDFLRWYLRACLPSRSLLVSCSQQGWLLGLTFIQLAV